MNDKKQIDIIINNNSFERIINLILIASENANTSNHQESLCALIQEEKNEIQLTSILLEILQNFNQCINKLTSIQNLKLLIYIKNILLKFKSKPKLKHIQNLETNIIEGINFYLNFNFNNSNNNDFNRIKKIYDEIIISLFDLIVVLKNPKNFLQQIYNKIILIYLNSNNNHSNYILSFESIIKFIYVYENFSRIYLIYVIKNEEINIIFDQYSELLKFCKNFCSNSNYISNESNKNKIDELNAKIINQCILSFSKTTMLCLDNLIKSYIFHFSSEIKGFNEKANNKNEKEIIFIANQSFIEFLSLSFYYDNNLNFFSFGLEYSNNNEKKFDFLISKGKGILVEVLTVLIKKLTKYELFNSYENFKSEVFKYFFNIIDYLISFYKNGNCPREKAENSQDEIIQLSIIVKIMNFIDEIIGNSVSYNLIEKNLYKINNDNKNEKYEEIFKYIIVPNLIQSDLEKTFFEFDQHEYIKNLFDMCHTCEVKLPKQKSIKLLMTFCDSIDGFLSKIVHVYILILKIISLNNSNNNNTNIEIEDKYKSLYLFLTQNINTFNLIEQSLQILTSISFLFGDNPDISNYFCDEIDLINYRIIKITDPFLKSKLCVFYSYNLEILFHNDEEVLSKSFDDSLNFIFDCIFNKTSNKSLIKTAFNCINEIIFNNYLKKFCVTSVRIYTLKVINYFNIKENLEGNEEEFKEFLKGIVKEYMYDLGDSIIDLFDLFWNQFIINLDKLETAQKNKYSNENNSSNNLKNNILRDRTKEVNESVELISEINIIKNFINMVINKEIEIKNNIFEKILNLFKKLSFYIDIEFEEEIFQIISKVIIDVKLLPDSYYFYLKEFLNTLNKVLIDNNFRYNIENYHLDFIFTCLQSFRRNLLSKENTKENLINYLNSRLSSVRRCMPIKKIISEHYIYCDMGLCLDIFFFSNFQKSEIMKLSEIFYRRMEKIPNTDYDLNVKLCQDIFLLFIKTENYDIFDEIFLNQKIINLYHFLCKVIQFFPVKHLSIIQQEINAIFCSLIMRYLILKQQNNQKILFNDENNLNDIDIQKIYFHIIALNLNILNIIKNKSKNIIIKCEENEEKIKSENSNKEIIVDSYEINETNGKNNFKKNTKMIYKERTPHDYSIWKKYDYLRKETNEKSIDYQADEDDFLINNENDNEDFDDENAEPMNENINDENISDDNNYNIYDDQNLDDKDEVFLSIKNESKNTFMHYYNKFANEELVVYLRKINEFHLFEIMMKDIEFNDLNFYNQLLGQIKTTFGEKKLELIEQFKGIQKIEFKNKNIFAYRKILKIQKDKK